MEPGGAHLRDAGEGQLVARFYVHAVDYDRGGEWSGKAFMCTRDKEFTIKGIGDCLARGYDRTGFFEVDTTQQRSDVAARRNDRSRRRSSRRNIAAILRPTEADQ